MQPGSLSTKHQTEPVGADAGGDSYVERIAAHNRMMGENALNVKELTGYWERTRDAAQKQLDAILPRIESLVGPDRDDTEGLDEEARGEYVKLAGVERELKTVLTTAKEMLDRLELTSDGGEDDDDGPKAPKRG